MKFGIYTLVIENFLSKSKFNMLDVGFGVLEYGWGNGYILLPPNHPFYEIDYDDIDVKVHGGLTFGEKFNSTHFLEWIKGREISGDITLYNFEQFNNYWIIGFDTNHFGDNIYNCPKEYVIDETSHLLEQCLDESNKEIKKYKYITLRKDKLNKINASII